jgi:tRNA nucleotidyltransferase (CCA-adding enzyme)
LRVAGGWVRDKLLATSEFQKFHRQDESPSGRRLTSKFHHKLQPQASMGRQGTKLVMNQHQPVDIDIALDDMLGREFADHLNEFLSKRGRETVPVGVVLKNPEKSKHLETATMKVGSFWIDFVNLRAEEYTQDSRIPDLMRIGTASEDAFRRDLTINALFYNINLGTVEDFTGRGFDDLRRGIVSTPLAPLTTLLDDPLRVLRAVRFAARLRFTIDDSLKKAAMDSKVRDALAQKVSRERVGGEVDLMLRSPDPVGAMRLLINLNLIETVFPIHTVLPKEFPGGVFIFTNGLNLLSTTFDYLLENKANPPIWCKSREPLTTHGFVETTLLEDEEARRLLWYAAFLKPLMDYSSLLDETRQNPNRGRKQNRSVICKLLVDHLKRPSRDAESIEKIMKAADDFSQLIESGCDLSAQSVLLSGIRIHNDPDSVTDSPRLSCKMGNMVVDSEDESDPLWQHAMEFRLLTSQVLHRVGPLWRAALVLSLIEQLVSLKETDLDYTIEGDVVS